MEQKSEDSKIPTPEISRSSVNFQIPGLYYPLIFPKAIDYLIIAIGKTGHGKSSVLNALSNWQNFFKEGETLSSVTSKITKKFCHLRNDFNKPFVCLVDTPGFYDSEKRDENILENLKSSLCSSKINAAIFCISMLESRLDLSIQNSLKAILEIMGKDFEKHMIFVFTQLNQMAISNIEKSKSKIIEEFPKLIQEKFGFNPRIAFFDYNSKANDGLSEFESLLPKEFSKFYACPTSKSTEIEKMNKLEEEKFELSWKIAIQKIEKEENKVKSELKNFNQKADQTRKERIAKQESEFREAETRIKLKEVEVKTFTNSEIIRIEQLKANYTTLINNQAQQISARIYNSINEMQNAFNTLENLKSHYSNELQTQLRESEKTIQAKSLEYDIVKKNFDYKVDLAVKKEKDLLMSFQNEYAKKLYSMIDELKITRQAIYNEFLSKLE